MTVTEAPMPGEFRGQSGESQIKASQYIESLKNRPIPDKYGTLAQTPLTITVTEDQQTYDIKLSR
ncbi:hypothetical protein [Thalassoroseus pseudoceratinae]|uniref:hypothetical protein n=1 Tax=Thalassoroseus pseudoceratinae TaxID=2713176 RepID=UPI001420AD58|nr:hypothetical protein [Thalassoroseus pseudoceratinae]